MLTFHYERDGNPISDFEAEEHVRRICSRYLELKTDLSFHICNDLIVDCIKLVVAEKVIPFHDVQIIFNNETITINQWGELSRYPPGFCDETRNVLRRLLEIRRNHGTQQKEKEKDTRK